MRWTAGPQRCRQEGCDLQSVAFLVLRVDRKQDLYREQASGWYATVVNHRQSGI
jgi:hypothetical protein